MMLTNCLLSYSMTYKQEFYARICRYSSREDYEGKLGQGINRKVIVVLEV